MVPRTFLFIFHAGSHRLDSNSFGTQVIKKKLLFWPVVSELSFCSLWFWSDNKTEVYWKEFFSLYCIFYNKKVKVRQMVYHKKLFPSNKNPFSNKKIWNTFIIHVLTLREKNCKNTVNHFLLNTFFCRNDSVRCRCVFKPQRVSKLSKD